MQEVITWAPHWHPDPGIIEGLVSLTVLYFLAVGPGRSYLAPGERFSRWQGLSFTLGTILVFLAVASPLDELSEQYLFSAHMFQHVILIFPVPVLWLWGTPGWLVKPLLDMDWSAPLLRFFTRPLVAFLVFNLLFYIWHIPGLYEWALRDSKIHFLEHATFMGAAVLQWWPLMAPLQVQKPLHHGWRLLYLLAGAIVQLPLFFMLAFMNRVFYPTYVNAPRITFLTPMADQQLGGIIMKVASMVTMFIAVAVVFGGWYLQENPHRRVRHAS
jgi:putative membrane protein